jgi:hypothetical protein
VTRFGFFFFSGPPLAFAERIGHTTGPCPSVPEARFSPIGHLFTLISYFKLQR